MPSDSRHKTSLKNLLNKIPTKDEMHHIALRLRDYPDEAAALVACSLLNHALRDAIASKFIKLSAIEIDGIFSDNQGGPLSTFASRIRIAYALGILGPRTRDDLNILRSVRNVIAHAVPKVDFTVQEVRAACAKIQFVSDADTAPAKELYVMTAAFFIWNLQTIAAQNRGDPGITAMMSPVELA
jgi:DNA-binding MltR family transcriptional regulator